MMMFTHSPVGAVVSLAAIVVLSLGLSLGLGVGLKTPGPALCSALADAIAARLDKGLNEDKEAFEQQLVNAGLPHLEVVEASPTTVDEAACAQPTPTPAVAFKFSLDGEVEGLISSKAAQDQLRVAISKQMDGLVREEDVSLSVVAGSATVSGIAMYRYSSNTPRLAVCLGRVLLPRADPSGIAMYSSNTTPLDLFLQCIHR